MKQSNVYVDLEGNALSLAGLDAEERRLVACLRRRARANRDWDVFDNYWARAVPAFYEARGLARAAVPRTLAWRIAQDLSGRLAVAAGAARPPDYRDELEELIRDRFPSRRVFCEAAGLSEATLSHVLAGRKDLSLATLTKALERVGYRLVIRPAAERKRTG
jgi:hypothetical protein